MKTFRQIIESKFMSNKEVLTVVKNANVGDKLIFAGITSNGKEKTLSFFKVKDSKENTILSKDKNLKINKGNKITGFKFLPNNKIVKLQASPSRPNAFTLNNIDNVRIEK